MHRRFNSRPPHPLSLRFRAGHRVVSSTVALWALVSVACAGISGSGSPPADSEPDFASPESDSLYTLGYELGSSMSRYRWSEQEAEAMSEGVRDAFAGKEPRVPLAENRRPAALMVQARMQAIREFEQREGMRFREEAAQREGATQTESGMVWTVLDAGSGEPAGDGDVLVLRYEGRLRTGKLFATSPSDKRYRTRFEKANLCWKEALSQVGVGAKVNLVCPPALSMGQTASGGIPPASTLVWDVEVLDIEKP